MCSRSPLNDDRQHQYHPDQPELGQVQSFSWVTGILRLMEMLGIQHGAIDLDFRSVSRDLSTTNLRSHVGT
jgi:hypothetical protein